MAKDAERWRKLFDGNLFQSPDESMRAEIVTDTVRREFGYFGDALFEVGCSKELVDLVGTTIKVPSKNAGLTGMFAELHEGFKEIYKAFKRYGKGDDSYVYRAGERAQMGPVLGKVKRTWSEVRRMLESEMPEGIKWVKYADSLTRSIDEVCTTMRNKHLVLCR